MQVAVVEAWEMFKGCLWALPEILQGANHDTACSLSWLMQDGGLPNPSLPCGKECHLVMAKMSCIPHSTRDPTLTCS